MLFNLTFSFITLIASPSTGLYDLLTRTIKQYFLPKSINLFFHSINYLPLKLLGQIMFLHENFSKTF